MVEIPGRAVHLAQSPHSEKVPCSRFIPQPDGCIRRDCGAAKIVFGDTWMATARAESGLAALDGSLLAFTWARRVSGQTAHGKTPQHRRFIPALFQRHYLHFMSIGL